MSRRDGLATRSPIVISRRYSPAQVYRQSSHHQGDGVDRSRTDKTRTPTGCYVRRTTFPIPRRLRSMRSLVSRLSSVRLTVAFEMSVRSTISLCSKTLSASSTVLYTSSSLLASRSETGSHACRRAGSSSLLVSPVDRCVCKSWFSVADVVADVESPLVRSTVALAPAAHAAAAMTAAVLTENRNT